MNQTVEVVAIWREAIIQHSSGSSVFPFHLVGLDKRGCGVSLHPGVARLSLCDRPEDEEAGMRAGVNFMPADIWLDRFRPGVYESNATPKQMEFLEGIELKGDRGMTTILVKLDHFV